MCMAETDTVHSEVDEAPEPPSLSLIGKPTSREMIRLSDREADPVGTETFPPETVLDGDVAQVSLLGAGRIRLISNKST